MNNFNINNVEQFNQNILLPTAFNNRNIISPVPIFFSNIYYNLIVYGNESWFCKTDHVTISKDRVLVEDEHITPKLKRRYSFLTDDAIKELKTFPCILAYENIKGGKTTLEHKAVIGQLRNVKILENEIEIYCNPFGESEDKLFYIKQQRLNELSSQFGIVGHEGSNELGHTHWTVKEVNLLETLRNNGMYYE